MRGLDEVPQLLPVDGRVLLVDEEEVVAVRGDELSDQGRRGVDGAADLHLPVLIFHTCQVYGRCWQCSQIGQILPHFDRLVLGCTEADPYNTQYILQHFSSSTFQAFKDLRAFSPTPDSNLQ